MKRKSILLCAITMLCLLVACGTSDDAENTSDTITVTDEMETETEVDLASQMVVEQYVVEEDVFGTIYTMYFVTVTNNSNITVKIDVNVVAKDVDGNVIGAADSEEGAIGTGETVCLRNRFSDIEGVECFEYSLVVSEDAYFESAVNDIEVQESRTDNKVILTCTNNGEKSVNDIEAYVLFFKDGEPVGYDWAPIGDYEVKPGTTISKELVFYDGYDDIKVFVHGHK